MRDREQQVVVMGRAAKIDEAPWLKVPTASARQHDPGVRLGVTELMQAKLADPEHDRVVEQRRAVPVGGLVETVEQRDILRALGCRYGQGYLFSRPLDALKARAFPG